MAVLPPVATNPPPELNVAKDGKEQAYKLINWLRRRVVGYGPGLGSAWWSTAIGRGDTLASVTTGIEVVGLQLQLPAAFPAFTMNFSGEASDTAGTGILRVRLGGTIGLTDGAVAATINVTSTGFGNYSTSAPITGNLQTLVTMTLQSVAGQTTHFKNGFLLGN